MVIKKVLTSIRELFLPPSFRFLVRFQSKLQFHRNQRWPTVTNKHSFKPSEWIFRDVNAKKPRLLKKSFLVFVQKTSSRTKFRARNLSGYVCMALKVRAQKNEHINGSLFLRHVNRKLLYDILKVQKSGCLTLLASCLILKERFLRRQMAAYLTRHSECLNSLTITGIPPSSLWIKKKQNYWLQSPTNLSGKFISSPPSDEFNAVYRESSLLVCNIVWGEGGSLFWWCHSVFSLRYLVSAFS